MKEWYTQLTQREQLSLLLMAGIVACYLAYTVLVAPLSAARAEKLEQNEAIAASLQRIDGLVSQVLVARKGGVKAGAGRNLTALINRSTAELGLQVTRLQPNSRGEIQVRFEGVPFDTLLRWLHQLEYRESLLVKEVSITQTGVQGRVSATIRVAQAS